MHYELIPLTEGTAVECKSPLSSVSDATDLVSACFEQHTDRLLLDASVLPPSFFELHTCFAGEFLQKLQNYRLQTAVVISPDVDYGVRFGEYLVEARRARFSGCFLCVKRPLRGYRMGSATGCVICHCCCPMRVLRS